MVALNPGAEINSDQFPVPDYLVTGNAVRQRPAHAGSHDKIECVDLATPPLKGNLEFQRNVAFRHAGSDTGQNRSKRLSVQASRLLQQSQFLSALATAQR